MFVIGIVGTRRRDDEYKDYQAVFKAIYENIPTDIPRDQIVFCSGGCKRGADRFVPRLASQFKVNFYEHLPELPENYDQLKGQYRLWVYTKACYDRNKLIAQDSNMLVACVADDRKGGTENTIKWFIKLYKGTRKIVLC